MDADTVRTIARLARARAERGASSARGDGLERLGASRALRQLAIDLDVSADALERSERRPSKRR